MSGARLYAALLSVCTCGAFVASQTNEICTMHTTNYFQNLELGVDWALQMFDSCTKLPDGLLMGTLPQLGNFDECIETIAPDFKGQYCRVTLNVTRSDGYVVASSLPWAVCAPSTCDHTGVAFVAENTMNPILASFNLQVSAQVITDSCFYQGDESSDLDAGFWGTISFFCVIIILVIMSTIVESVDASKMMFLEGCKIPRNRGRSVFMAFSLHTNTRELWSVRKPAVGTLACLHGMRVLSIAWVILGHQYVMDLGQPITNLKDAFIWFRNHWTTMPVMNGYLSVDTFFFMGGLLTCYVYMMEHAKGRSFNPFRYCVYRYLRITPALLICVLFLQNIVTHIASGPQFGVNVKAMADDCKENWWLTLLYVNNYVEFNDLCVSHSWYLSIDMQLAFLAPFAFVPLRRWPQPTSIVLTILTFALCFYTFAKTYIGEYWWTLVLIPLEGVNPNFLADIYVRTPHRASPYLVGIGVGYVLARLVRHRVHIKKTWVCLGWVLCTAAALTIVYSVAKCYSTDYEYNPVDAAFYGGFHRLGWALCLSWIVLACTFGYGGPVNSILSWPGWQPFSRLSYCAFLTHFPFMYWMNGVARNPVKYTHFRSVHRYLSNLIFATVMAMVLYLAVEAPVNNILRLVFSKDQSPKEKMGKDKNNDGKKQNTIKIERKK